MTPFNIWPVAAVLLLSACISKPQPVPAVTTASAASATPAPTEVVHTARYTLVSLTPEDTLRYPLRQITSHNLVISKKTPVITRGDALHTWLSGTGYGLCLPVTDDMRQFMGSPLPDNQRSSGPLRISDALQLIAGSAWQMSTDEVTRTVCFQHSPQTLS
ncbi:response regulator [Citrobacter sp. wls619]|uniref:PFGI-1 class ICE element type IV pilus protein PilL2 n=1 Tax=Citrobacter sp. wls619 TaxID=2576432 RepID=UPI00148536A6|nr:response regulator [Citrobacter sp. wls619]